LSLLPEFVVPNGRTSPFSPVVRVGNILFVSGQLGTGASAQGIGGETTAAMNEAYNAFFPDKRPARSSFGTTGLAQGGRVEIECIATVD
jgi:enamine deaminase RidA (YjgF/YER057c/UK114 family)